MPTAIYSQSTPKKLKLATLCLFFFTDSQVARWTLLGRNETIVSVKFAWQWNRKVGQYSTAFKLSKSYSVNSLRHSAQSKT